MLLVFLSEQPGCPRPASPGAGSVESKEGIRRRRDGLIRQRAGGRKRRRRSVNRERWCSSAVVTGGNGSALFHVASSGGGVGWLEIYLDVSIRGGGPAGHGLTG